MSLLLLISRHRLRSAIHHLSNHSLRLRSLSGVFSLTIVNSTRYVLKGDHDTLLSYNGKQARVTGTRKATKKSSSKPVILHVTDIKKLADFCP